MPKSTETRTLGIDKVHPYSFFMSGKTVRVHIICQSMIPSTLVSVLLATAIPTYSCKSTETRVLRRNHNLIDKVHHNLIDKV